MEFEKPYVALNYLYQPLDSTSKMFYNDIKQGESHAN